MYCVLNNNRIIIKFNYSPSLIVEIKRLEGRLWDKSNKTWSIPLVNADKSIKKLQQLGFNIDQAILDAITNAKANSDRQVALAKSTSKEFVGSNFETKLPLYDFQVATARFMVEVKQCLNANFVGSGKTITTLSALQYLGCRRILVIVPKSVLLQWKSEINKWLPDWQVYVVDGVPDTREAVYSAVRLPAISSTAPVVMIMGYETMMRDSGKYPALWDAVVADEAHRIGNTRTQTHKAIKKIESPVKYALTATPLMNRALDLFGIASWLQPGYLGTLTQFVDRYCIMNPWGGVEGTSRPEELAERFAPLMVRHSLEDVEIQLPEKIEEDILVELSPRERSLYDKMRKELLFELEKTEVSKLSSPMVLQNILTKMGKLQEVADSLELVGDKVESSKLSFCKDHLADVIQSGRKAIIFTRFERMAQILMRELKDAHPVLITGSVDSEARRDAMEKINSASESHLLISTDAGGVGINLQGASVVYNYDLPFSVGRYTQRIGRTHRIGQTKSVLVYNLIARKTIDEHIKKILRGKMELSAALLDNDKWSGEQVMELLED